MLATGKLDRRVTIRTPTVSRDSHGGMVRTYTDLATVWAWAFPVAGSKIFEAAQFIDGAQMRFQIRYRTDFDKDAQIVHDGKTYEVLRIDEIGRQEGLFVWAKLP